jgi:signal transduction histidine kinase
MRQLKMDYPTSQFPGLAAHRASSGEPGLTPVLFDRTEAERREVDRMASIGRMACTICHDLRHFLTAINVNAEFLEDPNTDICERSQLLLAVREAVFTMTDSIELLLQFGRTGPANRFSYERVSPVIQNAITAVRRHPEAKSVMVTLSALPSTKTELDARQLQRAIYNLLLNACQAAMMSESTPRVEIYLDEDGEWVYLKFADNGPGVPPSIRSTLFDPFVTEGKRDGTGLGLTLARRIAEEHGGSVFLGESTHGRTVFVLTLAKKRPS